METDNNMKTLLKNVILNFVDRLIVIRKKYIEIRKFQDPRRRRITNSIQLTIDQKNEIDDFYTKNYGSRIPYTWHRHYMAFTGKFDVHYFPELIYIPEFERYMNLWPEYGKALSDKNLFPYIAKATGVTMPKTIVSCVCSYYRDSDFCKIEKENVLSKLKNVGEIFCKPSIDSDSGEGCFVACIKNGKDFHSGLLTERLLKRLGDNFIIQERIVCHESLKKLYPLSVNTFRIMTYRWKDNILYTPSTLRLGRGGSYVDNIHSGGLCIAIDDDGSLHNFAFSEFLEKYDKHPDTGILFSRYKIDLFPKVLKAAVKLHNAIPQIGIIHWDFTINEKGEPVLIEANISGTSIQLIQRPRGEGPFGEKTAEILQWMRLMKKTKYTDRYKYAFGNISEREEITL